MLAISGGLSRDRLGVDHGGASQSWQPRSGKQGRNYVVHTSEFILVWSIKKDPFLRYQLHHCDA